MVEQPAAVGGTTDGALVTDGGWRVTHGPIARRAHPSISRLPGRAGLGGCSRRCRSGCSPRLGVLAYRPFRKLGAFLRAVGGGTAGGGRGSDASRSTPSGCPPGGHLSGRNADPWRTWVCGRQRAQGCETHHPWMGMGGRFAARAEQVRRFAWYPRVVWLFWK